VLVLGGVECPKRETTDGAAQSQAVSGESTVRSRSKFATVLILAMGQLFSTAEGNLTAPASPPAKAPEKIIIDTDIGTDIDDAFAVALALRSQELKVLGITTASGDTEARARILDRMLGEVGQQDIPVAVGAPTTLPYGATVDQHRYGESGHFARPTHPAAVAFLRDQIERHPGEITLVAIGPLTNVGGLIDQHPDVFRKLKRIVIMGGWIEPLKPDYGNATPAGPSPEYNIMGDIPGAQKLFQSGIPLYVMPFDSTAHLALDEINRHAIFSQGTALTDSLTLQYHQWNGGVTPVLFDAMTLAYLLEPKLCPVKPLHIRVDDKGATLVEPGTANAQVCLHSDADAFFRFYMNRLLAP
jgi:purine nucleosidase